MALLTLFSEQAGRSCVDKPGLIIPLVRRIRFSTIWSRP